jgi:hypothetical protein
MTSAGEASGRATQLRQQAELCERQSLLQSDPDMRQQFQMLARQWRELAQSIELMEARRTGFKTGAG